MVLQVTAASTRASLAGVSSSSLSRSNSLTRHETTCSSACGARKQPRLSLLKNSSNTTSLGLPAIQRTPTRRKLVRTSAISLNPWARATAPPPPPPPPPPPAVNNNMVSSFGLLQNALPIATASVATVANAARAFASKRLVTFVAKPGGFMYMVAVAVGALLAWAVRALMLSEQKVPRAKEGHHYCPSCNGFGFHRCTICSGRGVLHWEGKFTHVTPCPDCLGRRIQRCHTCLGNSERKVWKHLKVKDAYAKGGLLWYLTEVEQKLSKEKNADIDISRYRRVLGASAANERAAYRVKRNASKSFVSDARSATAYESVDDGILSRLLRNPNVEREERLRLEEEAKMQLAGASPGSPTPPALANGVTIAGNPKPVSTRTVGGVLGEAPLCTYEETIVTEARERFAPKKRVSKKRREPGRRNVEWGAIGWSTDD
ncbi:hypothetical protein NFJ02_14g16510 [Pycnococcus provasolii]